MKKKTPVLLFNSNFIANTVFHLVVCDLKRVFLNIQCHTPTNTYSIFHLRECNTLVLLWLYVLVTLHFVKVV